MTDLLPLPEPEFWKEEPHCFESGYTADQLRAYAAAAVEAERDRCVNLLHEHQKRVGHLHNYYAYAARIIRDQT